MGLSGDTKTSTTNQTQTAQTSSNQYQTAQQLAAQLQQQFGQQQQSYANENGPSAFAQPYIKQALDAAQAGYDPSSAAGVGKTIQDLIPSLVARYTGSSDAYAAPRSYLTAAMNDNGSNPQLEAMIAKTNADVGNGVNAFVGSRGLAGGSVQQQLLARELAKNETGLRYNDFTTQQARRDSAARSLADLAGAESGTSNNNLAALLSAAQAGVSIPQNASNSFASTIAQLLANATKQTGTSSGTSSGQTSGYSGSDTTGTSVGNSNTVGTVNGTTTEKSSGDWLSSLLNIAASAGSAALFSDRRMKQDIERIGELEDGLGVYRYRYRDGFGLPEGEQVGVMADEVGLLRPWALGPVVNGYSTVNYARLES